MTKIRKLYNDEFYKKRAREIFEEGFEHIINEEYDKAFHNFKTALKMDKTNAEYAYFCGLTSHYMESEEDIDYFRKALELDGNKVDYQFWYAISNYDRRNYGEAKKILLYAYSLNPDDPRIRLYLAKTMNKLNDFTQVIDFYENGVGLYKLTAEEFFELGCAYYYEIKLEDAKNMFEKAIKLDNKNKFFYYMLTQVYCKTKEFEKALNTLEKLKKELPNEERMVEEQKNAIKLLSSF